MSCFLDKERENWDRSSFALDRTDRTPPDLLALLFSLCHSPSKRVNLRTLHHKQHQMLLDFLLQSMLICQSQSDFFHLFGKVLIKFIHPLELLFEVLIGDDNLLLLVKIHCWILSSGLCIDAWFCRFMHPKWGIRFWIVRPRCWVFRTPSWSCWLYWIKHKEYLISAFLRFSWTASYSIFISL